MSRETSEISFNIGKRKHVDSARRKSEGRQHFRHSQLSSLLGRESRVMKRIYDRVDDLIKQENGQKRGNSIGLTEIYSEAK